MMNFGFLVRTWLLLPPSVRKLASKLFQRLTGRSLGSLFVENRQRVVSIQSGLGEGLVMKLDLPNERSYYLGLHEIDTQEALQRIVRPGMTAYNVGAHIGFFTLVLARLVGETGEVVAFEPNPRIHARLEENVRLNRFQSRVRIEVQAVSDLDGTAMLSLSLSDTQARFADLPHVEPGEVTPVPCTRIDSYVDAGNRAPDFLLIDAEHAEGRVLRGCTNLLRQRRPPILIEIHGLAAIHETWNELVKHRYRLSALPSLTTIRSKDEVVPLGHYLATHDRESTD